MSDAIILSGKPMEETHESLGFLPLLILFLVHALLALLMSQIAIVATLHALVALGVGVALALAARQKQVAYVAAYIAGSEVLWRMTDADVFWEFGKYATVAIFIVALLRARSAKLSPLILLYFLFLLPSTVFTVTNLPFAEARDQISFNLSGPLSLLMSVWFFSSLRFEQHEFKKIVTAFVAPMTGVATLVLTSIIRAGNVEWANSSNFVASGGFGPNQVSSVLGLGAVLIFLFLLSTQASVIEQVLFGLLGLWFLAQTALTFSRGGFVTAAIAMTIALMHALFTGKHRGKAVLLSLTAGILVVFLLFPYLDAVTSGALTVRYSDADLTNRDVLMRDDVQIFLNHPVFGVGPGMAKEYREIPAAAHTEFTRLLAEHGSMGVLSIVALIGFTLRAYWRTDRSSTMQGAVIALVLWAFGDMLHAAMRLVSVSFAFGFICASFYSLEHQRSRDDGYEQ